MPNVLTARGLRKSYGAQVASGVKLEVRAGEVFALIGPNGAGKTTTLRIIATLLTSSGGEITFLDDDLCKEPDFVREKMSYLPEEAGAYKNMKGIDYLHFMAAFYARNPEEEKEFVDRAVAITELGDRLRTKVGTYSKGMTRKLLLARALMTKPVLVILDEPTSGLDVLERPGGPGRSSAATSGRGRRSCSPPTICSRYEFLSDRVALIDKGRILDSGTPKGSRTSIAPRT